MAAGVKGLLRYGLLLLAIGVVLEGAGRAWQPLLRDACHRGLFKAAMLSRHAATRVVFFGTSRTGEALRPMSLRRALADASVTAFNASVQYSSIDQAVDLAPRFAASPGLELAVVELSRHALNRGDVPWREQAPSASADFDDRAAAALRARSALYAERKVFVFDSLARLAAILAFGARFDGTEQFGSDYVNKVFGAGDDPQPSAFLNVRCSPRPLVEAPAQLEAFAEQATMMQHIAEAYTARGVRVVFYVPPTREAMQAPEHNPEYRALFAAVQAKTGAPVLDFSDCQLPLEYFRDPIHMSHLGGAHFTHMVAAALGPNAFTARR
jgi:hypothetical protein